MKAELVEENGSFGINLTAETIEEAATMARFGLNHLRKIQSSGVAVHKEGRFTMWLVTAKRKDPDCFIGNAK